MRMLVGVALDDRITEMVLPAEVPFAHLLPEVLAAMGSRGRARTPRRLDGAWLDVERSLAQQGVGPGDLIVLEDREASSNAPSHDPVAELAGRGPPVELLTSRAAFGVVGGFLGAWAAAVSSGAAALVLAGAPVGWALLPLLAGMSEATTTHRAQQVLAGAATAAGAAALAASGPVAALGPLGLWLDGSVAGTVMVHVMRQHASNALLRVSLAAAEWCLVGAVLPLAVVIVGWTGW